MALLAPSGALSIYRGTTKTLALTVIQSGVTDSEGNPVPVPLLSGQVRILFSVKSQEDDKPALIQKTSDDPAQVLIVHPTGGKARIFLTPADTQHLDPGTYRFDIRLHYILTGQRYIIVKPSDFEVIQPVSFVPL